MKEIIDSADDSSVSCCHAALESGEIDHEDCLEMRQSASVEVEAITPLHALYGDDGPIIIDLNGPIRRSGRPPGRRRRLSMTEKTEGSSSSSEDQNTLPLHQQSIRPCTPSSSTRHPHTPRIDSLPRLQPITPSSTISTASSSSLSINSQLIGGGDGDLTSQNFHRSSSLNSTSSYSNSRSDSHIIINVHREDIDDDDDRGGGGGRRKIRWGEEEGARMVEQPALAPPSYRKRIIHSTEFIPPPPIPPSLDHNNNIIKGRRRRRSISGNNEDIECVRLKDVSSVRSRRQFILPILITLLTIIIMGSVGLVVVRWNYYHEEEDGITPSRLRRLFTLRYSSSSYTQPPILKAVGNSTSIQKKNTTRTNKHHYHHPKLSKSQLNMLSGLTKQEDRVRPAAAAAHSSSSRQPPNIKPKSTSPGHQPVTTHTTSLKEQLLSTLSHVAHNSNRNVTRKEVDLTDGSLDEGSPEASASNDEKEDGKTKETYPMLRTPSSPSEAVTPATSPTVTAAAAAAVAKEEKSEAMVDTSSHDEAESHEEHDSSRSSNVRRVSKFMVNDLVEQVLNDKTGTNRMLYPFKIMAVHHADDEELTNTNDIIASEYTGVRYTMTRLIDGYTVRYIPEIFLQQYHPYSIQSNALCQAEPDDDSSTDDDTDDEKRKRMVPCTILEHISSIPSSSPTWEKAIQGMNVGGHHPSHQYKIRYNVPHMRMTNAHDNYDDGSGVVVMPMEKLQRFGHFY